MLNDLKKELTYLRLANSFEEGSKTEQTDNISVSNFNMIAPFLISLG